MSRFAIGTLVSARGREWGVLPESQDDLVILRPLAGMAEEVTGIVGLLRRGGRVVPRPDVTPAAERCRHHRPRPRREWCRGPAGFWLWQVKSMDEAIDWVRRCRLRA